LEPLLHAYRLGAARLQFQTTRKRVNYHVSKREWKMVAKCHILRKIGAWPESQ